MEPITPASCSGKLPQQLDDTWTLHVGDLDRVAHVHVPASYDPSRPTALVLNFHGFHSDGGEEEAASDMSAKADKSNFVVIYPAGTGSPASWNAGACCGDAAMGKVDDIGFVRALITEAESRLCLDGKRVFATGLSNGAFLSQRIGCEVADRVAAIAPVAGMLLVPAASCKPVRPVPVMEFHGMADQIVPYTGNAQYGWPPVVETFKGWATRDKCTDKSPAETFNQGDAICQTYSHCAEHAEVTLCTISDGAHTWPGGPLPIAGTSKDISATDTIWNFFAAHPMP
jgi:polyhydroxybutyrate depolymerase